MYVLLDESLPHRLRGLLVGHQTATVSHMGWSGLRNGELLRQAAMEGFEVLITADRNLQYQQNISRSGIAAVVLIAPTNSLKDPVPLIPDVLETLPDLNAGLVVDIGGKTE